MIFSGAIVNTIIRPNCENGGITLGKFIMPRMDTVYFNGIVPIDENIRRGKFRRF